MLYIVLLNNIQYFAAYQSNEILNAIFLKLKLPHNHQHPNNVDKFSTTHYWSFLQRCVVLDINQNENSVKVS